MSSNPLDNCSEADLKRFALCWLNSARDTDWDRASAMYDPKVQKASFKTVTGRRAAAVERGTELEDKTKTPKKAAAAGKRKKAADEEDGETPKKKKGGRGNGKKKSATPEESEGEESPVKGEADEMV